MKKFFLFLICVFSFATWQLEAQTLNQTADWTNSSWTLTGTYDVTALEADPSVDGNFSYDDDAAGGGSTDILEATSPVIDLTAAHTAGETWLTVSLDYDYNFGDIFNLEYYDADAASWVVWEAIPDNSSTTSAWCAALPGMPITTNILNITSFTATQQSGFQYRLFYDASSVFGWGFCTAPPTITSQTPPSCPDPSGLATALPTGVGFDISWVENGTATEWDLEIGATGFTPTGTPTIEDVTANPYTWMGGAAMTTYDVYLRSDCAAGGGSGQSGWIGPVTATTGCVPEIAPFSESFDGTATPICWSQSATTGGPWVFGTPGFGWNTTGCGAIPTDHTGNGGNMAALDHSSTDAGVILELPDVDVSALTTPFLKLYHFMCGTGYSPLNETYVEAWDGSAWSQVALINTGSATWEEYGYDLTSFVYGTDLVRIRFRSESGGSSDDFYGDIAIDDVSIDEAPACPNPSSLAATNITTTGADLSWMENGTATVWDLEIGTTGFTPTGTPTDAGVANPYTWSSGSANMAYDFYVRADCGGGDYSDWIGPVTFNTLCVAFAIPFAEGFNSASSTENCWTVLDENGDLDTWDLNYATNPFEGDEVAVIHTDFNSGSNDDYLISPAITLTGAEQLKYQYRVQSSGEPNDFELLLSTTGKAAADFTTTLLPLTTYSNTTYMEEIVDLSAYSGDVYVAWRIPPGGLDGWRLYIDDVVFEEIPVCTPPTALAATVTNVGADLSWMENGTATVWDLEIGATGFTPTGTPTDAGVTNPYTWTSGMANTTYDFYVRADCGGGSFSPWEGPHTFSTLCVAFAIPFAEGFNSASSTENCWTVLDENGDGDAWDLNYNFNSFEGDQVAAISTDFNGGSNDDYLISPAITLTGGQQLTYQYRVQSSSEPNDFELLLSTSGSSAVDFTTTLLPLTSYSNTTYMEETVDLSAYSGDVYVAWRIPPGGLDGWRLYIDDVTFEDIPSCPDPSLLTATAITNVGADLGWMENGTATVWDLEIGATGFTPTGTPTDAGVTNPYSWTGGTAATTYDFYVRADCGGGDYSAWVGPVTFTTACDPETAPFAESFDAPSLPACWSQSATTGGPWVFGTPGFSWNTSGCAVTPTDHTGNGGNMAALDFSSPDAGVILELPDVNVSALTTPFLQFYHFMCGTGYSPLNETYIEAWDGSAWNQVALINTGSATWEEYGFNLGAFVYGTDLVRLRFRAESGGSTNVFYGDVAIDDVTIDEAPACPDPTSLAASNITTTGADLSWMENGTATVWDLEIGATGFTPTGTPTDAGVTNPYSWTGGTAMTTYDFYVRADCGGGDFSAWVGPVTFMTPCEAEIAPFLESFDGTSTPMCWSQSAATGGPWVFGTPGFTWNTSGCGAIPTDHTGNGGNMAALDHSSTDAGVILELPDVDVSALTTPYLQFYHFMCGAGYSPLNETYVEAWDGSAWSQVALINTGSATWEEYGYDLTSFVYGTDLVKIRFRSESGGSGDDFYGDIAIDDVSIDEAPSCFSPSSLAATNITTTGADLSWMENGTATVWDLEIGATGFTPTGTPTDVGVSNPESWTGGTAATTYDFYVRADCGGGDYSDWIGPVTFTTLCESFTTPWSDDFETTVTAKDVVPTCFVAESISGTAFISGEVAPVRNGIGANSGNNYVDIQWSNDDWLHSPGIDLVGGTSYDFSFYYAHTDASTGFTFDAWMGTSQAAVDMTTQVGATVTDPTNTSYFQFTGTIVAPSTGTFYFGLHVVGTGAPWYLNFDDFSVEETPPSCIDPSALTAANITNTGADLSWTENGTATAWDLEIGTAGFTPTGTPTDEDISNSYTWTAGMGETDYEYYVRADCGGGDESGWVGPHAFTTACDPPAAPTGVFALVLDSLTAAIAWDVNPAAGFFKIQYREKGTSSWTLINVPNRDYQRVAWIIRNLTKNTIYEYRMRQQCPDLTAGPYTSIQEFTTFTTSPCEIPESSKIVFTPNPSIVRLFIDYEPASEKYDVRWRTAPGAPITNKIFKKGVVGITGLTADTQYEYRVRTLCSGVWTGYSQWIQFMTNPTSPVSREIADDNFLPLEVAPKVSNVELFPNPASSEIFVRFDSDNMPLNIRIFDATGKFVRQIVPTSDIERVDVSNLHVGTYFVQTIFADKSTKALRFIKNE